MNESDLHRRQRENLQHLFDNMPLEKREAYVRCMKNDAVFKSAIPSAVVGVGVGYLSSTLWPAFKIGKGGMLALGALGYIIGKVRYMSVCVNTHFPEFVEAVKRETSMQRTHESTDTLMSVDEPKYQEPTGFGFDTYSNYNDNQLDANSNLDNDLSMDKPINLKPSLTYDELRKRHREEYYNSTKGQRFVHRPTPQPQPRPQPDAELLEDTTFQSDTQENSIWI